MHGTLSASRPCGRGCSRPSCQSGGPGGGENLLLDDGAIERRRAARQGADVARLGGNAAEGRREDKPPGEGGAQRREWMPQW